MYPKVGETCNFSFITAFNSFDGIYLIKSINSLNELLELEVDLVENIYVPVGLTELDYQNDVPSIRSDDIYKLESVEDQSIIYMPQSFNELIPDPNVYEYLQLGFGVDIGIFDDQTKIEWIKDQIAQALQAVAGVEKEPSLFEIKSTWMTETEYQAIDDARQALITDVTNHYTDKQLLIEENTRLKTMISEYENTLKILYTL